MDENAPVPLCASDDLVESVRQSTDGTPYSRKIRNNLQYMGLQLTRTTTIEAVRRTIDLTLMGPSVDAIRHLRETYTNDEENTAILVDPVTRDFIETRGNSVAGVLMAYRLAQDVDLVAPDLAKPVGVEIVKRGGFAFLDLAVELGQGVLWHTGRVRLMNGMPATYGMTAIGRSMREVVAHPLLNRHEMTIIGWDGVDLDVEYEVDPTPVLPEIRPRWRR